jgi:hypothetical protein
MTRRARPRNHPSFDGLQLRDDVDGTPCPWIDCLAHTDPHALCTNPTTGLPTRVPHIARIKTATQEPPCP